MCGPDLAALMASLVGSVSPRGLLLLLPPMGLSLLVAQGGPAVGLLTPAMHTLLALVSLCVCACVYVVCVCTCSLSRIGASIIFTL